MHDADDADDSDSDTINESNTWTKCFYNKVMCVVTSVWWPGKKTNKRNALATRLARYMPMARRACQLAQTDQHLFCT